MTETAKKYVSRLTVSRGCCPSYREGKAEGLCAWQWETKAVAVHSVVDQGSMDGPRSGYNLQKRGHTQLLAMLHHQRVPHTPKQAPSVRDRSDSSHQRHVSKYSFKELTVVAEMRKPFSPGRRVLRDLTIKILEVAGIAGLKARLSKDKYSGLREARLCHRSPDVPHSWLTGYLRLQLNPKVIDLHEILTFL